MALQQTFTVKTKQVNSKKLLAEVSEFVEEIILNFSITWSVDAQRDTILEVIDEFLEEKLNENEIEQWNVVCDGRNNTLKDQSMGIYRLDISYRQRNCFNTTELNYTIFDK